MVRPALVSPGCNSRPAVNAAIQGSKSVVLVVVVAEAVSVACWIVLASSAASGDNEGVGYGSNLEQVYGSSSEGTSSLVSSSALSSASSSASSLAFSLVK